MNRKLSSKREIYVRVIKHIKLTCLVSVIILGLVPISIVMEYRAQGYNAGSYPSADETHQWITGKSIDYLLARNNTKTWMYRNIINSYLGDIIEGVWIADHTGSTICEWKYDVFFDERRTAYDCDTLHHYYQTGPIETNWDFLELFDDDPFINVAYPGELTASRYANGLYNTAVKFWPNGPQPSLGGLEYVDAGYTTLPNFSSGPFGISSSPSGTTGDLFNTYIGGIPQCERLYRDILRSVYLENPPSDIIRRCLWNGCHVRCPNDVPDLPGYQGDMYCGFTYEDLKDLGCWKNFWSCITTRISIYALEQARTVYCPAWPKRYDGQPISGIENIHDALFYLGWVLHLIQDLTVPYHVTNDAREDHQKWENSISNDIRNHTSFVHLPLEPGATYHFSNLTAVDDLFNVVSNVSMIEFGNYIANSTLSLASQLSGIALQEALLDMAIKASAAIVEKFFSDVSPSDDYFEDNDNRSSAKGVFLHPGAIEGEYIGQYSGLTIYPTRGPNTEMDCYRFSIAENFTDVFIDVLYQRVTGEEFVSLKLYKGDTDLQEKFTETGELGYGKHLEARNFLAGNDYVVCLESGTDFPFSYELDIRLLPNNYMRTNPYIDVTPNTIYLGSATDKRELTIYNRGGVSLQISDISTELEVQNIGPVFVVDFDYGSNPCGVLPITISSLGYCTVGLGANSALLNVVAADYSDQVMISSNDHLQGFLLVDLFLNYGPSIPGNFETHLPWMDPSAPYIFTTNTEVNFGDVFINNEVTVGSTFYNLGGQALVVTNISLSKAEDFSYHSAQKGDYIFVPPGGVGTIYLTFKPREIASKSAHLTIRSNDPHRPETVIFLSGTGMGAPPPVFPSEGTVGSKVIISGSGLGEKKGKVFLGSQELKVLGWTDSMILCGVKTPVTPGPYDITIEPKQSSAVMIKNGFLVQEPQVSSVSPAEVKPAEAVTIKGSFFGSKRGEVYLNTETGESPCRVTRWKMNVITGESEIRAVVPKGVMPGSYKISVKNKVGEGYGTVTIE